MGYMFLKCFRGSRDFKGVREGFRRILWRSKGFRGVPGVCMRFQRNSGEEVSGVLLGSRGVTGGFKGFRNVPGVQEVSRFIRGISQTLKPI